MENLSPEILRNKLKECADLITADDSSYVKVMGAVRELHTMLAGIGSVNAEADAKAGTYVKAGYALSAEEAGRCIFDLARTRKFSRGIIKAIQEKKAVDQELPLQILYAGCGPYALLVLLLTPYFTADEIQLTVIDIHQQSIDSVKNLTEKLQLAPYFKKMICADALTLQRKDTGEFDLLIIETMNGALKKEPQVSMTIHLTPMLKSNGVLIPEKIEVRPAFTEINIRSALQMGEDHSKFTAPASFVYEPIAILNLHTVFTENSEKPFSEFLFDLKEDFLQPDYELELQTEITVYAGEVISGFDSSVSLPYKIINAAELKEKKGIRLWYANKHEPKFNWEYV